MPMIIRIFTCIVLFYTSSFGQNKQYINRLLQVGAYKVKANYGYYASKGDTIPQGAFTMKSFGADAASADLKQYFSLNGTFQNQMPGSAWRFQFGKFKLDGTQELVNYQLNVKLSGVFHTALVNFREGKTHGKWSHKINRVDKSNIKETLFESSALLENGLAKGIIRMEDTQAILLGRFLKNGFAHDVWEVNFGNAPDRTEQWHFKEGRLEKIVLEKDFQPKTIYLYKDNIPQATTVSLDHVYLKILSLQHLSDSTSYTKIGSKIASLIRQNSYCNQKINDIFAGMTSISGKAIQMPLFQVKVARYPLIEAEKAHIANLKADYEKSLEVSKFLLTNTKLNILKHADEEVLFLLSVVQEVNKKYLSVIKKIVEYQAMGVLDFWQRNRMQLQLGLDKKYSPEVLVSLQDSTNTQQKAFTGPNPALLNADEVGYAYLAKIAQYARSCVDSVAQKLNKKLSNQEIQRQLDALEKVIIQKFDQLNRLSDSLGKKLPKRYKTTTKAMRLAVNKEIKLYSTNEDLSTKSAQARGIISCLDNMKSLFSTLAQLPKRWDTIQKLYTEQVWNPFTATIMNDQIKERLTEAYHQLLVPSILTKIKVGLTCAQAKELRSILDQLYVQMKVFRKQDTSKLERKLRRENDPNTVLELFGISTQIKNLKR